MAFDHAAPAETPDPHAALLARSIATRCAAARDLSRFGRPEDIPALLRLAAEDRSPAVRLGAAGAVADILSRYRLPPRRDELDAARRQAYLDAFKGIDPAENPGLFSMLACIGTPEGAQRIAAGLRDPRGDVRLGAAIGLLRLLSSLAAMGDASLEAMVLGLLTDPRLRPDAAAEVAWVAARVGLRTARPAIAALRLEGAQAELVQRALQLLDRQEEPLHGLFASDGRDAGEIQPEPSLPPALAAFGPEGVIFDGLLPGGPSFVDAVVPGGLRRMLLRRVGETEPVPAVQFDGRTWYRAGEGELFTLVERLAGEDPLADDGPRTGLAERHAAALLGPLLPGDGAGEHARGLLLLRAERPDEALTAFLAAAEAKRRPSAEARYFAGRLLLARGQGEAGREQLEAFVRKARRKDPRRERAERLLAEG